MASNRKPKSTSREMWGILNRYGDVWTSDAFETPAAARQHLNTYWRDFPGGPHDTSGFKIVKVRVRVSSIYPIREPSDDR